jgi:TetR/AcrR family transcriptional regulator, regulator of autoinduction and epiphytic fitness
MARRTLYNQFSSKEEIFREMLLRLSGQLENEFPSGVETEGDVEDVLRLVARIILELRKHPEYLGLPSHGGDRRPPVSLDRRRVRHGHGSPNRVFRALGILDCRNPLLAAHQFMGMLNDSYLCGPWMVGREGLPVSAEDAVEETIRIALPAPTIETARCRDPILGKAGGSLEPGSNRWLIERRRLGPVIRSQRQAMAQLFQ